LVTSLQGIENIAEENSSVFSLIRMRWLLLSNGILSTNKIPQFLTGGASYPVTQVDLYNSCKKGGWMVDN